MLARSLALAFLALLSMFASLTVSIGRHVAASTMCFGRVRYLDGRRRGHPLCLLVIVVSLLSVPVLPLLFGGRGVLRWGRLLPVMVPFVFSFPVSTALVLAGIVDGV